MKINRVDLQHFSELLKSFISLPFAIFTIDGTLISCTEITRSEYAKEIIRQYLLSPEKVSSLSNLFNAHISFLKSSDNIPICIILIMETNLTDTLFRPIQSLLNAYLKTQEVMDDCSSISDSESDSFAYQLLSPDQKPQKDLVDVTSPRFGSIRSLRLVIIFHIDSFESSYSSELPLDFSSENILHDFLQVIHSVHGSSSDDIGIPINLTNFALIKTINNAGSSNLNVQSIVGPYIHSVFKSFQQLYNIHLHAYAGSLYNELCDIKQSYREALFLQQNSDYLCCDLYECLYINDYIYDYLMSTLPKSYFQNKFSKEIKLLLKHTVLNQTIISLSAHNMNLRAAATDLHIHRNTIQQRFDKIKSCFESMNSDADSIRLRQYSFYIRHKIILSAATIIQSSNVLIILLNKLAERVYINSGHSMELSVQTIGLSGDNRNLFKILQAGDLDIAVGNPNAIIDYTGKQLSIIDAPFLFTSAEEGLAMLNGELGKILLAPVKKDDLIALGWWSMGWRYLSFSDDNPLYTPEIMKGKRIRIMEKPLVKDFFNYINSIPYYIGYSNIASALRDKVIDMQENPYKNFYEMEFYKYQRYILELKIFFDSDILMTTFKTMNKLTSDQQEILYKSVQEVNAWNNSCFYSLTEHCKTQIEALGVRIIHPSEDIIQKWKIIASTFMEQSNYMDVYKKVSEIKKRNHY